MVLLRLDSETGRWERTPIPEKGLALCADEHGALELREGAGDPAIAALLPFVENGRERTALLAGPAARAVFVDGYRPLGVSVLEERAELLALGERLYFSEYARLRVETLLEGHAEIPPCPRCTHAFAAGDEILACPRCRSVHHEGTLAEGGQRLCFSYDSSCTVCRTERSELEWTPEPSGA